MEHVLNSEKKEGQLKACQVDDFDQDVKNGTAAIRWHQIVTVNDGTVDRQFTVNSNGSVLTTINEYSEGSDIGETFQIRN